MNRMNIKKNRNTLCPTLQDAQTIEDEIENEIDDFLQTASESNKIDAAATRQKKVDFYDKLMT